MPHLTTQTTQKSASNYLVPDTAAHTQMFGRATARGAKATLMAHEEPKT